MGLRPSQKRPAPINNIPATLLTALRPPPTPEEREVIVNNIIRTVAPQYQNAVRNAIQRPQRQSRFFPRTDWGDKYQMGPDALFRERETDFLNCVDLSGRQIPALRGKSNFAEWRAALREALEEMGLCRFIEGSVPEPESASGDSSSISGSSDNGREREMWCFDRELAREVLAGADEKDPYMTMEAVKRVFGPLELMGNNCRGV
ncbi:hypothetical protein B0T16DRAFT_443225 [Cercophora newfieldiana]|uniref:Uncharacterized protein n=1 Tax=Cercophora newfieldiana TaxID=92897 RepID=A0AA39YFU1_9PEZI|nr:hypothetical protein B0T16DRAFT_443225 [Cercophora newfieldiana]